MNLRQDAYESRISFYLALLFQDRIAKMSNIHFKRERNTFLYITLRLLLYLSPVKRICVFEHPSLQILTAHAQPFSGARDLAFCLKVPLDSLLVWASSEGSGETARMRRLAWTFASRIGDKYQIRLTRSTW